MSAEMYDVDTKKSQNRKHIFVINEPLHRKQAFNFLVWCKRHVNTSF